MKIGIMGLGQVGETLEYGFRRIGHQVRGYDPKLRGSRPEDVLDTELCFVCVPTPSNPNGSCDVSCVEAAVRELWSLGYGGIAVIKSTVTPGTTDRLQKQVNYMRLAFCPEFLREKSRFSDFVENHDVCIIGCDEEDVQTYEAIKEAHGSLPKQFVWCSPMEAEFAKYFSNCFNALRITFANEFAAVCEKAGVSYANVKNAIVKRASIGDHYLESNENFRAFGGSCLPKDLESFISFAQCEGIDPYLLRAVGVVNHHSKKRESERDASAA